MKRSMIVYMSLAIAVVVSGCGPGRQLSNEEKLDAIGTMAAENLERLYSERPSARDEINSAAGYAAFSNANVNLIFASAGGGYGVVVNNSTGEKTYMRMGLGGLGLGLGVKDYRQVLVFPTTETMNKFIESGWVFGGHADAAAQAGDKGGALSAEGAIGEVRVYTMTEAGLAIQATVTGTKYWKDNALN